MPKMATKKEAFILFSFSFDEKELNKFVQEEFIRLDIKVDNGVSVIKIIEPAEDGRC